MDVQRLLHVLGGGLFALTVITGLCLPPGMIPSIVSAILALVTAVIFLGVMVMTLAKNHRLNGLIKAFVYASLILMLVAGAGSYFLGNNMLVEIPYGETVELNDEGYLLALSDSNRVNLENQSFDVVLTQPDMVSFHETISQSNPLKVKGMNIHPMEYGDDGVIFLVEQDSCKKIMMLGGILFLIGLGLLALPASRKRGER